LCVILLLGESYAAFRLAINSATVGQLDV